MRTRSYKRMKAETEERIRKDLQNKKCKICKREGLTLDKNDICHKCWQDIQDSKGGDHEDKSCNGD